MPSYVRLAVGDPAPLFEQEASCNPKYALHTAAWRYILLCFFGSSRNQASARVFTRVLGEHRALFDDRKISFFGVSADPRDKSSGPAKERLPGIRYFWDSDLKVSRLYGSAPIESEDKDRLHLAGLWYVLDPAMRIIKVSPFRNHDRDVAELLAFLKALPPVDRYAGIELQAPILFLPNVFEAQLCQTLIGLYETGGGTDSGFMREEGGRTVEKFDYAHKRRRDHLLAVQAVIDQVNARIHRRVVPEIKKAYQFNATRIERHLVACYSAEEGGHFGQHRDNTTKGTAHRRFAVSINLNSDFEGGDICFPEYGSRTFRAPPGGAVIFSCSLLHCVLPVKRGRRFAFLPFLYDEEAKKIRDANIKYVDLER